MALLSPEVVRTLLLGSLGGLAYLGLVVGSMTRVYPDERLTDWLSPQTADRRRIASLAGGLWFTGFVASSLFLGVGAILPVGLLALDYLLFVADPHGGGDTRGPFVLLGWPAYVVLFGVFGIVEYGSLLLVAGAPPLAATARDILVGTLFAAMVGVGLSVALPLWRVLPLSHSLPIQIENDGESAHEVTVRVVDTTDETTVSAETIRLGAGESVSIEDAVTRLGRYRIEATLPDGTTDEYVFEPRRRASVRGVVVWIDGELGGFRVVGQGSGP
ncbi:hypothetical protein [Haloarchaeobius amylolyticus]|uniref:hypothetical protein n=1 Tax=Haloarchaeobius amylolyticus TaxID=1198296 RepID=UPI002270DDF1|nr:hypothetical protein [Haloarchaeobius amylolyticus]